MTAATSTLTDFLLARIAEDEAVAQAASGESPVPWRDDKGSLVDAGGNGVAGFPGVSNTPHIARHDPARVLAECEAKRRIVELNSLNSQHREVIVRTLAAIWSDHPDYREEWRP